MREIRISAKALIIVDGRMLAIRISDGGEEWYIIPGGGLDPEESLNDAVKREVAEETGLDIEPGEMLFAIEGIHGETFHRIDLVFECKYIGLLDSPTIHQDTCQDGIEWLEISKLNTLPLYPSKLRRQIMNYHEGISRKTYLGNEEIGDAEITD